jgi:DNA-binding transcriptional ArsR family regulator
MDHQRQAPIDQRLVRALAHPLRVQILEILSDRVTSPNRIADELETNVSHVAYHTRALDKFGCLDLIDTARRRGATEHFYKATPRAFVGDRAWRGVPPTLLSGVSGATLQTFIDKAVDALEAGTLDGRGDTIFRWMPLLLDEQGWAEVVAIMEAATEAALAAHLESQDRLAEAGPDGAVSTVIGLACFETGGAGRARKSTG